MAKPPPPPPAPLVDPTIGFQTFATSIADEMSQELLSLFGTGTVLPGGTVAGGFETECVFFSLAGNTQQGYTALRDGFILGWNSTLANNFAIAIAIDAPSVVVGVGAGIRTGLVFAPFATSFQAEGRPAMRFRFKQNDLINVRTVSATGIGLWMYLGYPI